MKMSASIDWLTFSSKMTYPNMPHGPVAIPHARYLAERVIPKITDREAVLVRDTPRRFYVVSVRDKVTGVRMHIPERISEQGWLIEMSGAALGKIEQPAKLRDRMAEFAPKVTRFDIALDLINSGFDIAWHHRREQLSTPDGAGRSLSLIESKTGDTMYVGSRTSEKYLRFYDKGREQNTATDWKRVELETKGDVARVAFATWPSNPASIFATMRDMLLDKNSELYETLSGLAADASRLKGDKVRVTPKRGIWLRGQVLSAIETYSHDELDDLIDWLQAAVHVAWDRREERATRALENTIMTSEQKVVE